MVRNRLGYCLFLVSFVMNRSAAIGMEVRNILGGCQNLGIDEIMDLLNLNFI